MSLDVAGGTLPPPHNVKVKGPTARRAAFRSEQHKHAAKTESVAKGGARPVTRRQYLQDPEIVQDADSGDKPRHCRGSTVADAPVAPRQSTRARQPTGAALFFFASH